MDFFDFDNVKAEKEDAVYRYNMERNLRNGLRLIGFSLFLFLLSCSWFPTLIPDTVEAVGNSSCCFISYFNNPFFTFFVVNIIVVLVYVLSSQKLTQKQTTSHDLDIYHENVTSRRIIPTVVAATEETTVDKQIFLVENAVVLSPVKQQCSTIVDTVTETKRSCGNHILSRSNSDQAAPITPSKNKSMLTPCFSKFVHRLENSCDSFLSPIKQQPTTIRTVPKTKEYRRTRSRISESRNQRVPREFRRSGTAMISGELVISGTEPPRKSMDEMSSEEFQLIIDSFIAEKKKTLMLENTRRKENCMSILAKN